MKEIMSILVLFNIFRNLLTSESFREMSIVDTCTEIRFPLCFRFHIVTGLLNIFNWTIVSDVNQPDETLSISSMKKIYIYEMKMNTKIICHLISSLLHSLRWIQIYYEYTWKMNVK